MSPGFGGVKADPENRVFAAGAGVFEAAFPPLSGEIVDEGAPNNELVPPIPPTPPKTPPPPAGVEGDAVFEGFVEVVAPKSPTVCGFPVNQVEA